MARRWAVDTLVAAPDSCRVALPDLDALIAEAERTYLAAHQDIAGHQHREPREPREQTEGEPPDRIELLRAAVAVADRLRGLADDLVEDYVEQARLHGRSWTEVGAVLGVTRQAAEQRYRAPHYDPAAFADEICAAVAHMRETARRHHNGFIGTEHMLCGLLAEDNSAVRLLSSLDIPADTVRQRVQRSLTVGASHAAKRIA